MKNRLHFWHSPSAGLKISSLGFTERVFYIFRYIQFVTKLSSQISLRTVHCYFYFLQIILGYYKIQMLSDWTVSFLSLIAAWTLPCSGPLIKLFSSQSEAVNKDPYDLVPSSWLPDLLVFVAGSSLWSWHLFPSLLPHQCSQNF